MYGKSGFELIGIVSVKNEGDRFLLYFKTISGNAIEGLRTIGLKTRSEVVGFLRSLGQLQNGDPDLYVPTNLFIPGGGFSAFYNKTQARNAWGDAWLQQHQNGSLVSWLNRN